MKFPSSKDVVCIIILFFTIDIFSGCATQHRSNTKPPLRFKNELDSLRSHTATSKSTKYTIKNGDTIWRIAYNYGVSPNSIININHIKDVTNIKPGQQIIIPAGITSERKTPSQNIPTRKSNESFLWPLRGKILSGFEQWVDGNKNTGIDIKAFNGQAVKASKGGIVALTSDTPDGWGKVIVLQHDDGSYTWYAYNSQILVKKGDKVTQGQIIAKAGSTGRAEQDKLHFKIFLHGVAVNPSYHLQ